MKLIEYIYWQLGAFNSKENCVVKYALDGFDKINALLPSGSGLNEGSALDFINSTQELIKIKSNYFLIDDEACTYDWKSFEVIVKPSFVSLDVQIKFQNNYRNYDLEEYLSELFLNCLIQEIE